MYTEETDTDTIRAVAEELRRYTPGVSHEDIAAYIRRYRNLTVTGDDVRQVLHTAA